MASKANHRREENILLNSLACSEYIINLPGPQLPWGHTHAFHRHSFWSDQELLKLKYVKQWYNEMMYNNSKLIMADDQFSLWQQ